MQNEKLTSTGHFNNVMGLNNDIGYPITGAAIAKFRREIWDLVWEMLLIFTLGDFTFPRSAYNIGSIQL